MKAAACGLRIHRATIHHTLCHPKHSEGSKVSRKNARAQSRAAFTPAQRDTAFVGFDFSSQDAVTTITEPQTQGVRQERFQLERQRGVPVTREMTSRSPQNHLQRGLWTKVEAVGRREKAGGPAKRGRRPERSQGPHQAHFWLDGVVERVGGPKSLFQNTLV